MCGFCTILSDFRIFYVGTKELRQDDLEIKQEFCRTKKCCEKVKVTCSLVEESKSNIKVNISLPNNKQ